MHVEFYFTVRRARRIHFAARADVIRRRGPAAFAPAFAPPEPLERRVLMAAGYLDPSFDGDGRVVRAAGSAAAVVVQSDGKTITAGAIESTTGAGFDFLVSRYNVDGSPDTTFGQGGSVRTDFAGRSDIARSLALQGNGRIVVAGSSGREFALARYNADGTLDATFDGDGMLTTAFATGPGVGGVALDVAIQPDGRIVAAGSASPSPGEATFALARYNADGSLDDSFDDDGRVTTAFGLTAAYGVAIGADGKIVAGGTADTNLGDSALARYNANGSLDSAFGPFPATGGGAPPAGVMLGVFGGAEVYDEIRDVAVDADGSIVAAGSLEGRGMAVARVAADGASRQIFEAAEFPGGPGGGASASSAATAVILKPGEWVLASGYTLDADGQLENFATVRFNPDGVVDRTFGFRGVAVTDFRHATNAGSPDDRDPQDAAAGARAGPGRCRRRGGHVQRPRGAGALPRRGRRNSAPGLGRRVEHLCSRRLVVDGTAAGNDVRLYPSIGVIPRFVVDQDGSLFLAPLGVVAGGRQRARRRRRRRRVVPRILLPARSRRWRRQRRHHRRPCGRHPSWRRRQRPPRRPRRRGRAPRRARRRHRRLFVPDRRPQHHPRRRRQRRRRRVGQRHARRRDGARRVRKRPHRRVVGQQRPPRQRRQRHARRRPWRGHGRRRRRRRPDPGFRGGAGGRIAGDYYSGGTGFDTVDYSGRSARMLIRLNLYALASGGGRDRDTLRDVEGAVGGSGDDRIEGTTFSNRLVGGPGNDILLDGRGNDTLLGGAGDDVLTDTSGTNTLDGEAGVDTVNGVREPATSVLLEAENATLVGATVDRANAGYTGTGYADFTLSSGAYIEFTFDNTSGAGHADADLPLRQRRRATGPWN